MTVFEIGVFGSDIMTRTRRRESASGHQESGGEQVNRIARLIEHRTANGDGPLPRFGTRWRYVDDFALQAEDVAGTGGARPGELSTETDDTVRNRQATGSEEPHGDGRGVPATRHQPLKKAGLCGAFVQMERLRVKLRGEVLDVSGFHNMGSGGELLSDPEIL